MNVSEEIRIHAAIMDVCSEHPHVKIMAMKVVLCGEHTDWLW